MSTGFSEIISRLNDLQMTSINTYRRQYEQIGTNQYIKILDMNNYNSAVKIECNVDFRIYNRGAFLGIHSMIFDVYHSAGEYKIDVKTNIFENENYIEGIYIFRDLNNNDSVYLKTTEHVSGNNITNRINFNITVNKSAYVLVPINKTVTNSLSSDPIVKVKTDILSKGSLSNVLNIYQKENDIIFDVGNQKIKIKTLADPYSTSYNAGEEYEGFIVGDELYGFSTLKIKENIEDVPTEMFTEFIRKMPDLKMFDYKEGYETSREVRKDISFIIEELKERDIPFIDVLLHEKEYNGEKLDAYYINTLIMIMLGVIKEQQKQIDELKKKIEA